MTIICVYWQFAILGYSKLKSWLPDGNLTSLQMVPNLQIPNRIPAKLNFFSKMIKNDKMRKRKTENLKINLKKEQDDIKMIA